MTTENQVCTKQQAQKLYDLGLRKDSLFAYVDDKLEYLPMK